MEKPAAVELPIHALRFIQYRAENNCGCGLEQYVGSSQEKCYKVREVVRRDVHFCDENKCEERMFLPLSKATERPQHHCSLSRRAFMNISSVSIVTPENRSYISGSRTDFSLRHCVKTGSEDNQRISGALSVVVKCLGREVEHLPVFTAQS
jgi:hypothetical protein